MEFGTPEFWFAALQISFIDILLGGDNAVVIALACRGLPAKQRKLGIFWGVFGAVALRVAITIFALALLAIPYLKIVGGVLLLWIGTQLILPDEGGDGHQIDAGTSLYGAIKTIIVADFVMSLDNVVGVAAAARDSMLLIVFGLLLSIPIIVGCSQIILRLMGRFPVIIVLGGMLLGYIAGDMMARDHAIAAWVDLNVHWLVQYKAAGIAGALLVLASGWLLASRKQ